jgi:hypothetical protein
MGFKKSVIFADFKMGLFIFVSSSIQKLEPKDTIFRDFPKNRVLSLVRCLVLYDNK